MAPVSPVWPDLAKIRHLGNMLENFAYYERVHLVFDKFLMLMGKL